MSVQHFIRLGFFFKDKLVSKFIPKYLSYIFTDIMPKYSKDQLEQAVAQVKAGDLSLGKTSKEFGIPKMTLSDHVNGKVG